MLRWFMTGKIWVFTRSLFMVVFVIGAISWLRPFAARLCIVACAAEFSGIAVGRPRCWSASLACAPASDLLRVSR
jgi:hypothetical protein